MSSNGWEQHSLMVLKELENLSRSMQALRDELQGLKNELAEMRGQQVNILELKEWKNKIDEVCSPSQLEQLKKETEDLKHFKTKAVTVFVVIQFIMAVAVFLEKFI
tara:strand:+ start:1618 stop:1935 length:318 start_codon:yes stop_codon:yes gene_type:complete